jgi:Zn-dependent membrane protease YugP
VLRLSPPVHDEESLSAIGVACHEAGHALQHAQNYLPLTLRTTLVPATNISSQMSYILVMAGFLMNVPILIKAAVICFGVALLFSVITLPVEWDASARAKQQIVSAGIVSSREQAGAAKVLNAAFLTYVASAITALLTFLYYFMRSRR